MSLQELYFKILAAFFILLQETMQKSYTQWSTTGPWHIPKQYCCAVHTLTELNKSFGNFLYSNLNLGFFCFLPATKTKTSSAGYSVNSGVPEYVCLIPHTSAYNEALPPNPGAGRQAATSLSSMVHSSVWAAEWMLNPIEKQGVTKTRAGRGISRNTGTSTTKLLPTGHHPPLNLVFEI